MCLKRAKFKAILNPLRQEHFLKHYNSLEVTLQMAAPSFFAIRPSKSEAVMRYHMSRLQPFKGGSRSFHLIEFAAKSRIPRVEERNRIVFVNEVPRRRAACHQPDNALSWYAERRSCEYEWQYVQKALVFR